MDTWLYAGKTNGPFVGYTDLPEAHPGRHAAWKTVLLAHGLEHFHHLAVHQAEITRIHGDFYLGDAVDDPVE